MQLPVDTSDLRQWLQRVDPGAAALLARPNPVSRAPANGLPQTAGVGVPRGRLPWLPRTSPQLIGRLLVTAAAFAELENDGILIAREENALPDSDTLDLFGAAYCWMRWQMKQRVPGYSGNYPLWMWTRIHRYDLVGHLDRSSAGSKLLTVRVDRSRVLVTPYDDWHFVLNGWLMHPRLCQQCREPTCTDWDGHYLPYMEARDEEWIASLARCQLSTSHPWHQYPNELLLELLQSWEHLFDLSGPSALQGCIEFLTPADVIEIRDVASARL